MKKTLISLFILLLEFCLVGCVDNPKGPVTQDPYGQYDSTRLYSKCPMFATQEVIDDKLKFTFTYAFKDGVNSCVVSLEDIVCDYTLQLLFNAPVDDAVLKENYVALYFIRIEPVLTESLRDVSYTDLEIKDGKVDVALTYNKYTDEGFAAIMRIEGLILVPKDWVESLDQATNFEVNFTKINK